MHTESSALADPVNAAHPVRSWAWAIGLYLVLYGALLAAMYLREGYEFEEALFVLASYGLLLSGLAWLSTLGLSPRDVPVRHPAAETQLILIYFLFLVVFITFGFTAVRSLAASEL